MNPLVHFVKLGAAKGLDPSPLFGMKDYLARYPDLVAAGAEPLSHFIEYGRLDKRTFSRPLYFTERLNSDYTPAEVLDGRVLRPEASHSGLLRLRALECGIYSRRSDSGLSERVHERAHSVAFRQLQSAGGSVDRHRRPQGLVEPAFLRALGFWGKCKLFV